MFARRRKLAIFGLVLAMLTASLALSSCGTAEETSADVEQVTEANTVTIQDSADRYVEVPYPVESIVVLWDNPTEELAALGAVDRIVGVDEATKADIDLGYYPELADIPVIGSCEEPNYEAIAEVDPDVVICLSSYPPLPDEIAGQLAPFDIPVVALDFYRTDVYFREITTLGVMLGLEDEASDYIAFFKEPLDLIAERVADIPDAERKTVYFEGADDYGTYGGAGYGCGIPGMIVSGGGVDLYPEITAEWFEADPEDIAQRNPDFIMKGQAAGYFLADDSDFRAVHDGIMARAELSAGTAVTQDQVYVMSFDISGGARKKFGPMFVAKILYPELFADFDPQSILQQYYEDYLGLEWQGVYVYPAIAG